MNHRAVVSNKEKLDSTANFILKINESLLKTFGKPQRNFNSDPVDILIATIISQNTNDINSHKAFRNLKKQFSKNDGILNASLITIEKAIKIAGLAKQKSKAIKNALKKIYNDNGKLSLDFLKNLEIEEALNYLSSFNGVGLKTAACVLLFGLHRNVCPVDTHIHRILNRIGIVNTRDRNKTFYELNKFLPDGIAHEFHTNLIKLGRITCLSQKPKCFECPLNSLCKYEKKNLVIPVFNKTIINKNKDFMLLDNVI